jgi:hypothetical protein
MTLAEHLDRKKTAVVKAWVAAAMACYPAETVGFLKSDRGRFHNPVGFTLKRDVEALFDFLMADGPREEAIEPLDRIIAQRVLQDLSPAQALGFVFELKAVIRRELSEPLEGEELRQELEIMDRAVDRLGMMAFEVYTARRHRIHEIRYDELRRNHHMLLRRAGMLDEGPTDPSP